MRGKYTKPDIIPPPPKPSNKGRREIVDRYLITYKHKERSGSLVYTKTKTEVLTIDELENLTKGNTRDDNNMEIIFCQKV